MNARVVGLIAVVFPFAASAQTSGPDSVAIRVLPNEQQIAGAVSPAPEDMRAGATVLGYTPEGKLTTLRVGTNDLICLADDPARPGFHAACYHRALEPFMARGRALRARGLNPDQVDSLRRPTALYQLSAPADSVDALTGTARGARALHVMYIPYATEKSTGLSGKPIKGPWLMDAGLPWAHIMYTP
jgi:hypothetical protein